MKKFPRMGASNAARRLLVAASCFCLLTRSVDALDITTRDGSSFRGCEVTHVEPTGIRIRHRDGVAFIGFDDLPKNLQTKYGWTPEKSAILKAERSRRLETPSKASVPGSREAVLPSASTSTPHGTDSAKSKVPSLSSGATPTNRIEESSPPPLPHPVRSEVIADKQSTIKANGLSGNFVAILTLALATVVIGFLFRRKSNKAKAAVKSEEPRPISQPPPGSREEQRPNLRFRPPEVTNRGTTPERVPVSTISQPTNAGLTWCAASQSVEVAGLRVVGGMFYTAGKAPRWPGEPSAIVTSLSVARHAAHPLQDFGYYPSYENLSAEQRRCYLEWLSSGRCDSEPAQRTLGYVFIFFYGLERRILIDRDSDPALLEEIIRLLQLYGPAHKSRSLKSYALQLLHFGGWLLGSEAYRALWPRLLEFDGERADPDGLRFVLANLHQRGEPLDWTVAYRVALANDESRRSTVVTRAREKFWQLFEQRFVEQFPGGLPLQASKQPALLQYRPASSALVQMSYERRGPHPLEFRLPNVSGFHRQFKALPEIWNSCVDDLSGYSRVLGGKKQGQAAAVAAWQALPMELRSAESHPLQEVFDELLTAAPKEGDYTFVPAGTLASLADISERAKLTTAQSRQVAELVCGLGWQLAPNPEVTGLPLAWNQELALYPSIPGEESGQGRSGIARLLYLAISVAAADGVVEEEELAAFRRLVAPEIPDESNWRPLLATEASLRRDTNVAVRALPQIAKLVPAKSRPTVLRTMVRIAAADGEVSLDEMKLLRRIARALGLEVDAIEKLLREDESFREVTLERAPEKVRRGEAIPAHPVARIAGFALDHERIKALTQETHEVISLLSGVMADSDSVENATMVTDSSTVASQSAEWLDGLEPRFHAATQHLVCHDEITTAEFDSIAMLHHLMPDDLFDSVNAWADERLGDFLLERGENVRVFRVLLPADYSVPLAA